MVAIAEPLVKEFLIQSTGEDGYSLVHCLSKKGMTDEELAKKARKDVSDIRSLLNRLHELGVVHYSKVKAERSNWYTYTWFPREERISELMRSRFQEKLEKLKQTYEYENGRQYFHCGDENCEKVEMEIIHEYDYKCPKCGKRTDLMDNSGNLGALRGEISAIERFLNGG